MPALDTTASSVAMGQMNNLPFGNIIGAPLNAAIEAQAKAAQTTVDFVQSVGFQDNNGQLEAVNLRFIFEDGAGVFRRVQVPLLTVIPIPFIIVDAVDIQFKARIAASAKQSSEERKQTAGSVKADAKFRFWGQRLDVSASYSSKKDSKATQESKYSVEYTMDVHVHASQSGITQGMAEVLNILQDGISNTPSETQITIFSLSPVITATGTTLDDTSFNVLVLDSRGEPINDASVELTSTNGLIMAPSVNSGTSGVYALTMSTPSAVPSGTNQTESLQITVTVDAGGPDEEITSLARAVTIIGA